MHFIERNFCNKSPDSAALDIKGRMGLFHKVKQLSHRLIST